MITIETLLPIPAVAALSHPTNASQQAADPPIPVYSTAGDDAQIVGTLSAGERVTPMAETQGIGGVKWYLVKIPSGTIGWIRQSDNEHSKKVDSFFRALPPEPASTAVAIPNISSASAPRGAIIIPILLSGRSTVVTVTLNRTITANLTLDTGATNTVISRRLAALLSLRPTGNAAVQTVGGVIAVALARLQSLKVGDAEVTDLPVIVHDFSRDPRLEGLLGMDFLGRYRIGLDIQKQVLVLLPR